MSIIKKQKCEHQWSLIKNINYSTQITEYDDVIEAWGYVFQDKIYECKKCNAEKIITRICRISEEVNKNSENYKSFKRIPSWFKKEDNVTTIEEFGNPNDVFLNRFLDYPDFPPLKYLDIPLDGKTIIIETILYK